MKRFQKNLSMMAAVAGLTAAFAFTPAKSHFTNYWFNTTAAGVPTTYNASGPTCSQTTGNYCSKEYAASQINFSGSTPVSVKSGQENNQIAAERLGN